MYQNPAGATRWNAIQDACLANVTRDRKTIRAALNADGHLPFTDAIKSPREQYERLVALRAANSPIYWNDPTAVKALIQLAQRFGPPPAPQAPPLAIPMSAPGQPFPSGGP